MLADWFLSDAGWLFFGAWSVVVAAVSFAAFRRDLVPRVQVKAAPETHPSDPAPAKETASR